MKKMTLLILLWGFMEQTNAQPAKGTPALDKTGGWIFNDWGNSSNTFYNPMGPGDDNFPEMTFFGAIGNLSPSGKLKEKLTAIRDIFKAAYPNPQGCSMLYQFAADKNKKDSTPRFIRFSITACGLEHDGKGGLHTVNIAAHQGDAKFAGNPPNYDGIVSVYLNRVPPDNSYDFFQKQDQFTDVIKTKKIPNLSGVYLRPPQNNFGEADRYFKEKNLPLPNKNIGNSADNYFVFRHMEYFEFKEQGIVERHMDKIIMTSNGKIPYQALNRKTFLDLLLLHVNMELEKFPKQAENYKAQKAIIQKLIEINADKLNKPATLNVTHKNIIKNLSFYTINKNNQIELKIDELKEVFIDDINLGYTPCRLIKFYKSDKDEDFQTIMVNWSYEIPAGNNEKYKDHASLDNRSLYQAIKNKLDWDELAKLLLK